MRYLKLYEYFTEIPYDLIKKSEIEKICKQLNIRNFKINSNFSIDVDNEVFLDGYLIQLIFMPNKLPIKFNKIHGNFDCSRNGLTTLENSPTYVKYSFDCEKNNLTTLLEGPQYVGGFYNFQTNNLKDVYGFPETFDGMVGSANNPVAEILTLVEWEMQTRFIKILNEYKVIRVRNGDVIIESRLRDTLSEMGINELAKTEFKNYRLI